MMVKCKKAGECLAGNCMHIVEHEQIDSCHDYRASMEGCGGTCDPVVLDVSDPEVASSIKKLMGEMSKPRDVNEWIKNIPGVSSAVVRSIFSGGVRWQKSKPCPSCQEKDKEQKRLRGMLLRSEWAQYGYCQFCLKHHSEGHAPDCEMKKILEGK